MGPSQTRTWDPTSSPLCGVCLLVRPYGTRCVSVCTFPIFKCGRYLEVPFEVWGSGSVSVGVRSWTKDPCVGLVSLPLSL